MSLKWVLTFVLLFFNSKSMAMMELLGALTELQSILSSDNDIMKAVHGYMQKQEFQLNKIKSYVESFKEIQDGAQENFADFIGNPINAYLFVKRLTVDWKELEDLITTSKSQDLGNLAQLLSGTNSNPVEEDLNNVALAIARLQDVYQLNMSDIVRGKLGTIETGIKLSANDCLRMGRQSLMNLDLDVALDWFQQGLVLTDKKEDTASTINKHIEQLKFIKSLLKTSKDLITPEMLKSLAAIPGIPSELFHHVLGKEDDSSPEAQVQKVYKQLCRGEQLLSPQFSSQMDCIYLMHDITGALQRTKVEYLSYQPLLVIIHDAITDSEIEIIKTLSLPKLEETKVHKFENTNEIKQSTVRVGKFAWLDRISHPIIDTLYKRTEEFTGLSVETAESLHVVNYKIGGHYEVHADFFDYHSREMESEHGDRIATLLFYLTDVPGGGATVFPHLQIAVQPQKGSALFWFNLLRSGKGDYRMVHAACPVLAGNKWVANFWLLDRGQPFRRPCSTKEEE